MKKIFIFLALAFCLSVPAFAYDGSVSSINGFVNTSIVYDGSYSRSFPSWYDSSEYPYYFVASGGNGEYFVASKVPSYVHYWTFNSSGQALDIVGSGGVKYSKYNGSLGLWASPTTADSMSVTVAEKRDSNSSISYRYLYSYNHNIVWDSNPGQVFFSIPGWTPPPVPPRPLEEVVKEMQGEQMQVSLIPSLTGSLGVLVPFGIGLLASLAALATLPKVLRKFLA